MWVGMITPLLALAHKTSCHLPHSLFPPLPTGCWVQGNSVSPSPADSISMGVWVEQKTLHSHICYQMNVSLAKIKLVLYLNHWDWKFTCYHCLYYLANKMGLDWANEFSTLTERMDHLNQKAILSANQLFWENTWWWWLNWSSVWLKWD